MLSKIILHKASSSYSEKQIVHGLNRRVNFFYGLNGSGKTTLSRYLKELENNSPLYEDCSHKWYNDEPCRVLVYNQDFIKDTFLQSHAGVRGVFVGEDNKEVLLSIEEAENTLNEILLPSKTSSEKKIKEISINLNNLKNSFKEKIWQIKQDYESMAFKEAMRGFMGSKDTFSEKILNTPHAENISFTDDAFKNLEKEMTALQSEEIIILDDLPTLETTHLENILKDPLWGECIVNTQEGYLAGIVRALANDHQAWIEQGTKFVHEQAENCPFCQQAVDEKVRQALIKLVDDTYKRKKEAISELQRQYVAIKLSIENTTKQYTGIDNPSLRGTIDHLSVKLEKNIRIISEKIEQPSSVLTLEVHKQEVEAINTIIAGENENRRSLREQMANRKQALKDACNKFWQLVRSKYDSDIVKYQREQKKIEGEKQKALEQQKNFQNQIDAQNSIICDQRNKTKNIENAAESINRRLKSFSMQGFHLKKRDANSYFIARDNEQEGSFEELSEGEKTLISFLYFVELCEEQKSDDSRSKLIVIDDPISSLSFNTVFEVSCLIKRQFLKNDNKKYCSVFILTHHLYFLHELLGVFDEKKKNSEYNLFRIFKSPHSKIESMERRSIKNHYEGYWQVVRDAHSNQGLPVIFLANAMRNILEHFCAFVQNEAKLAEVFTKLKRKDADTFTPFHRCMDRNNHSDADTIIDENEIDVGKFLQYFKTTFIELGYEEHYNCMMGNEKIDIPEQKSIAT
jgi:wobble nucleotide-excising tRNase